MRYRVVAISVVVIILVMAGLCLAEEITPRKLWTYYLAGDYEKVIELYRSASGKDNLGNEGYYVISLSFLKLGCYEEARKNFEFVKELYPQSPIMDALLLGIADSYYMEARFDKAQDCYTELLKKFPSTSYASIAYLRLGECQKKEAKWQEAEASFRKVVLDFPFSLEYKTAKEYLENKNGHFTVQLGAFSKGKNAYRFSALLKNKGYDSYVEKKQEGDRLIYKVKVGRFDMPDKAEDAAATLRKKGFSAKVCN